MRAKTHTPRRSPVCAFLPGLFLLVLALAAVAEPPPFRAGAHVAEISPVKFPVIAALAPKIADAIIGEAKKLAPERIGWVVVDDWGINADK